MFQITFHYFHIFEVLITSLFSMVATFIGINSSRNIKLSKNKVRTTIISAVVMGFTFWLSHFFTAYTIDIPFSTNNYVLYFATNFLLCFTGSYIAIYLAQYQTFNLLRYIIGSIMLAIVILSAELGGFYVLYQDLIDIKPILLIVSIILVVGMSFSTLRFLIQVTNEDIFTTKKSWKFIAGMLAGTSIAGIPYILLISILDLQSVFGEAPQYSYLVPFIFMIVSNLLLMLVPDIFGEKILMKALSKYQSLEHHNHSAVFSIDLSGFITSVNKEGIKLTGYSEEELLTLNIAQLLPKERTKWVVKNMNSVLFGETKNIESQVIRKDGSLIDVKINAVRIIVDKVVIGAFGIVEDITEAKKAQQTIEHLAYYDELTNLPNRRKLREVLDELVDDNQVFSVILIDFDRFKRINDNFGHTFGDYFLVEVAKSLTNVIPEDCLVARLGGDEFLIIVPETENVTLTAQKLIHEFRSPIQVYGIELLVTASLGIASFPHDTGEIDELLKFADIAMYQAKDNGANKFAHFSHDMINDQFDLTLENDFRRAIDNKELMLYFQPKMNVYKNEVIGCEALLRWMHPKEGFISPGVFIPLAEEVGLIVPLERYVIREVCKRIASWTEMGLQPVRVSMNISMDSLFQEDFIHYLLKNMREFNIDGSMLELEITERIVMKNEEYVNKTLQKLRELGIEISIDDFGTGYSSLSYLYKLHVDRLKIDKLFIDICLENAEIVATIIAMAGSLHLKVIAEGVETEEQLRVLKELGCKEVQGFYFSKPLPSDEYEKLLKEIAIIK
ncbi:EAL domain-containing protein [Bacillus suaedaesalsae]|uniref:EAL domain-containing protein n=1 Tax=Bacillus suaedaesalsae TaxID=2810349 RepID=A0ABS2DMA8_9BACI|nr:EAL domain-containing protein [Bacillus suaedaesalsae]MBM6619640.1 EAL domain-containing protein [Bacillus suaedaesalsae]